MITAPQTRLREPWRAHDATHAGILIDARDYYRAFYAVAKQAKRSILLLGWQFDSDVELVRGDDLPPGVSPEDVRLLGFLEGLCAANPELEVRVLAWDHSVVFAMERELLQKLWFNLRTNDRFFFEVDSTVPEYGAHHQKVAVIDGEIAFLGSSDICQDRWDTSAHVCDDALRVGRSGKPCKPYHEVQAVVSGDAARSLLELFVERWADARGEQLDADTLMGNAEAPLSLPVVTFDMPTAPVGIYRQLPHRLGRPPVREVKELLISGIRAAERFIYIETQYFTSEAVAEALTARFADTSRARLDVVLVLPHKPDAFKEELAVGRSQAKLLQELARFAAESGHALGVYNVAVKRGSEDLFVYIHSKLMIVDDRMLTLGSTNLTNRSMSLDSEINAVWSDDSNGGEVADAIARLRRRLLEEHIGRRVDEATLAGRGLVGRLDAIVLDGHARLRAHDMTSAEPSPLFEVVQGVASAYADPAHAPESRSAADAIQAMQKAREA